MQQEVSHAKDRERELLLQQMDFEKSQEMKAIHDRWSKEEQQMQNEISSLQNELQQMSSVWSAKLEEEKAKIRMEADQLEKTSQLTVSNLVEDIKQLEKSHEESVARLMDQHEANIKEMQESQLSEHKNAIEALQIAHQAVLNQLKEEHCQALKLQQEQLQQEYEQNKELLKEQLYQKHRQELCHQIEIQVKEMAAIKSDLDQLAEISKKKERDYLQDTDKLKEEIEKKEKYVKNLKCEVEKLQQTTDQLLSELDAKKKDLADTKIEQQLQLEQMEDRLIANAEKEKENIKEDHIQEMHQLVSEFSRAQQLLKNKISVLNMELLQSEERYKNRESRAEDLEEICRLRNTITDRETQMKKFQEEKRFFQMELINRETNFNKIFGSTPQVGVINPLNKKTKGGEKILRKFTSAPSLQQSLHNRLEHLPGSPVHEEHLNPIRPLPPMPPSAKKYVK